MKHSTINFATIVPFVALVLSALLLSPPAEAQIIDRPQTPLEYLSGMIKDPKTTNETLAALGTTNDKALVPLLVAMTKSKQENRRLFGVSTLPDLDGKRSANTLIERVNYDQSMPIRAEALARLISLDVSRRSTWPGR